MVGSNATPKHTQVPVWSITELQRYGFRGAFPTELCPAPGLLVERTMQSKRKSELDATYFETVSTTYITARPLDGVTLMLYRLTPVSRLKSTSLSAA